jgi:hypothetical protein
MLSFIKRDAVVSFSKQGGSVGLGNVTRYGVTTLI